MSETYQSEQRAWHERWWFLARCFAAWAVIQAVLQIFLVPVHSIQVAARVDHFSSPDFFDVSLVASQQELLIWFTAIHFLVCGFFLPTFLRPHWWRYTTGVVFVSIVNAIWNSGWPTYRILAMRDTYNRFAETNPAVSYAPPDFQQLALAALTDWLPILLLPLGVAIRSLLIARRSKRGV